MRLLVVGGVRSASGYGRVVREVGRALAGLGEIVFVQVGQDDARIAAGPVLSTPDPYDFVSYRFVPEVIRDWEPDVTLIIHDLAYCAALVGEISCGAGASRLVTYCPFEGILAHTALLPMLLQADTVVLYSQHDVRVLRGLEAAAHPPSPDPARAQIVAIPHGVDRTTFRPVLTGPQGRIDPAGATSRGARSSGGRRFSGLVSRAQRQQERRAKEDRRHASGVCSVRRRQTAWGQVAAEVVGSSVDGCDIAAIVQALGGERVLMTGAFGMPGHARRWRLELAVQRGRCRHEHERSRGLGLIV